MRIGSKHIHGKLLKTFSGFLFACLFSGLFGLTAGPAFAQTVSQFTNSTDSAAGEINGATLCNTAVAFQRDFFVTESFAIQDVNLGVLMAHNDRNDYAHFLRSPEGTIVTVKNRTGGVADNFNVLYDDQAAASINGHSANDNATAATNVPPYQRTFRPANNLNAALAGENSFGRWTLFICDFDNDNVNGTFFQADLFLQPQSNIADLSLAQSVASSSASSAIFTLSVTNANSSDLVANGVQVRNILPAGVSFVSASGTGTYNSATGIWNVGSVAVGQTVSLDINVTISATPGTVITNNAEITASSQTDPDSTPNNGNTGEDDFASESFTVGGRLPGIAPNIGAICSVAGSGTTRLDWNNLAAGESWTPGSTQNSFTVANIGQVDFDITSEGSFSSPLALTFDNNGGLGTGGLSLFVSIEYANTAEETETVVTLPTAVPGAQFTIFDIDFAPADFADRLRVLGSFNGGPQFNATLTNGSVNFISNGEAIGDGLSGTADNDGNVTVTFAQPVDTITIIYGNGPGAPADPLGQAISIHDFTFCTPATQLSVTKISQVLEDPVNGTTDPKAIPGATVRYCILVNNPGSATAQNVLASDALVQNITFVPGTLQSGTNCSGTLTAEDDDDAGADEADPFGISYDAAASPQGTVAGTAASLAPGGNFAIIFNVTVD